MFTLQHRLRRAVLHPNLVLSEDTNVEGTSDDTADSSLNVNDMIKQFAQDEDSDQPGETYAHTVLKNLSAESDEECPICMDIMEDPVLIPVCMHKGCVLYLHGEALTEEISHSCKDCISAYLHGRAEKGEEGACPTCSRGPVKVFSGNY